MFEGFSERRVSTGEAEIFVRIGGKGPPLLLLHGFPQTHVAWYRVAPLMTALGHERFGLAGHDRGARVGYRLCLDQPARVERFAAIDIIPTLDVWDGMNADKALASYHWTFLAVPAPVPE